MSFIEDFLNHSRLYESPGSFWTWAAYSAISAALRDSVWIKDGDAKLFINIYVLFVAGSGQKKGRPIGLAEEIVDSVGNINIISGRSSIQAILTEIGHTETNSKGQIKRGGAAIFFAPELSAGIVQDDQAIQILTDIYDYKAIGHTTNLVGRGKKKLDATFFSMLVASNEELLRDFMGSKAIYGGFLGRTFLVIPDEFRPAYPFPLGDPDSLIKLKSQLREISMNMSGELKFADAAQRLYTDWYVSWREETKKQNDKVGIINRIPTHVKKLAAIFAANELSGNILKVHIQKAMDVCINMLPNYRLFAYSAGKSTIKEAGVAIIEAFDTKTQLDYRELVRDNWQNFEPEVLDKALAAFELSGMLTTKISGSNKMYILTAKGKEILKGGKGDATTTGA